VLAVSRDTTMDDERYRQWARAAIEASGQEVDEACGEWCDSCLYYQPVGAGKATEYEALAARIAAIEKAHKLPGNRVIYLALPPAAFAGTIEGLGKAGLSANDGGWTRLVVEKPFGKDLASAEALNRLVHEYFDEAQVYRIDHYLGKETVQNLLVFRFANPVFETLWHRDRVESVQITVAEELGIEDRAGYYEKSGALRDMVQNHLAQLLTLVAMEVPVAFEADAIRYEKVKVLRAVASIDEGEVALGQYRAGEVHGEAVPGYREEKGVADDSEVETFVALRLEVDNWRWQGVPFYLRTGKRLPRRLTQIAVVFKRAPVALFRGVDEAEGDPHRNVLHLTLQPDEGFALSFEVKAPGEPFRLETLPLHFSYGEAFGELPEAYETLLLDVLTGDQTLFVRADEVEAAWRLFAPLLDMPLEVHPYDAGDWGPKAADKLLTRDGEHWRIMEPSEHVPGVRRSQMTDADLEDIALSEAGLARWIDDVEAEELS